MSTTAHDVSNHTQHDAMPVTLTTTFTPYGDC